MYFTYVLKCLRKKDNKEILYVGYTEDINKRLQKHRSGAVETTRNFDQVDIIYYEACLNKTDAMRRENQLKTGFGRGYINRRLENYLKVGMRW